MPHRGFAGAALRCAAALSCSGPGALLRCAAVLPAHAASVLGLRRVPGRGQAARLASWRRLETRAAGSSSGP